MWFYAAYKQHASGLIGNDHYYFGSKSQLLSQFTLSRTSKIALYYCLPGISPVPVTGRVSIIWLFLQLGDNFQVSSCLFLFFSFWKYKTKWNLNYKVATFHNTWIMWIWCSLVWRRTKEITFCLRLGRRKQIWVE